MSDRTPLLNRGRTTHPVIVPGTLLANLASEKKNTPSASVADEWRANPLSYLTWSWLAPLVRLGRQRPLQQSDLGGLAPCDQSALLAEDLLRRFASLPASRGPNLHLWLCLAAMQKTNFTCGSIAKEVGDLLAFVGPIALQGIVAFVTDKANGTAVPSLGGLEVGYWWVIASCGASVVQSLSLHHSYQVRSLLVQIATVVDFGPMAIAASTAGLHPSGHPVEAGHFARNLSQSIAPLSRSAPGVGQRQGAQSRVQ